MLSWKVSYGVSVCQSSEVKNKMYGMFISQAREEYQFRHLESLPLDSKGGELCCYLRSFILPLYFCIAILLHRLDFAISIQQCLSSSNQSNTARLPQSGVDGVACSKLHLATIYATKMRNRASKLQQQCLFPKTLSLDSGSKNYFGSFKVLLVKEISTTLSIYPKLVSTSSNKEKK